MRPIVSALIEATDSAKSQAHQQCALTLPELLYQVQQGLELDGRQHHRPNRRNASVEVSPGQTEIWVPVQVARGRAGTAVVVVEGKEPPRAQVITVQGTSPSGLRGRLNRRDPPTNFHKALVASGLTAEGLAILLDVSVPTVQRWLAGTHLPHPNVRAGILARLL